MGLFDGTSLERPVICEVCEQDVKDCSCDTRAPKAEVQEIEPGKQSLVVRLEKRKRGKLVTVVAGFQESPKQIQKTFTLLKNQCGAGGAMGEGGFEIQGNHREKLLSSLRELGFRVT